jgi:hypothetical protein
LQHFQLPSTFYAAPPLGEGSLLESGNGGFFGGVFHKEGFGFGDSQKGLDLAGDIDKPYLVPCPVKLHNFRQAVHIIAN